MKKNLLLLLLTALTITAGAQQPLPAKYIVYYNFSHVRDTAARNAAYKESMALAVAPTVTEYRSVDEITAMEDFKKSLMEQLKEQGALNDPSKIKSININKKRPTTSTKMLLYLADNKFMTVENLGKKYAIELPVPEMHWTITADTASFGGLKCQKATTNFGGRKYTAWFTPKIAVASGPWKLHGLPGLILDAHDDKMEVVFAFAGIEKADALPVAKQQPEALGDAKINFKGLDDALNMIGIAGAEKMDTKEYLRLKEIQAKDPEGFARAMFPGAAVLGGNKTFTSRSTTYSIVNNPLELPVKK